MQLKSLTKVALVCAIGVFSPWTMAAPSESLKSQMQTMGKIKEVKPFQGGLTSWILEAPNGKNAVFYTTADEQVILHGTAWNAKNKANISNPLKAAAKELNKPKLNASSSSNVSSSANIKDAYNHPVFRAIKTLSGIKEGKGGENETVYIIYDPRCTYCHQTFDHTRSYVSSGATIKWIPALVLNQSENGKQLAAGILRNPNVNTLNKAFNGSDAEINSLKVIPTAAELQTLEKHLGALQSIFYYHEDIVAMPQEEKEQRAAMRQKGLTPEPINPGVPVAIFVNKRTGKVEARRGTSDLATLDYIFK